MVSREYLDELLARADEIKEETQKQEIAQAKKPKKLLVDRFKDSDGNDDGCLMCML